MFDDPFARCGAAIARRRWLVLAVWAVVVILAGGLFASRTASVLKAGGYVVTGSESDRATDLLEREFNLSVNNNLVVVFRSPSQTVDDAEYRREVELAAERLAAVPGVVNVDSFYASRLPQLVSEDRQTTSLLVSLEGDEGEVQERVPAVREALDGVQLEHYVTGLPAVNHDTQVTSEEDLRRAEVFTIPIVLLLLLFVFRTVVASAIPLVLGVCSVIVTLAALYFIGSWTDTSIFALNVTSMIGLGLGIDFALIVVSRFRDELAAGRDPTDAIAVTMATAGRSITYSGVIVLLSMAVLTLLFPFVLVRSISLAVLLVAATALLAAWTLLPALLAALGPRIEWLRVVPRGRPPRPGEVGFWYRLSHTIMRRPWLWLTVSLGILVVLALPVRDLKLIGIEPGALPADTESVQGFALFSEALGSNPLDPIQIVMRADEENGAWTPAFLTAIQRLTDAVAQDPRTEEVISLATAARDAGLPAEQFTTLTPELVRADPVRAAQAARLINLNGANNAAVIVITPKPGRYDEPHQDFIRDLRERIIPGIPEARPFQVEVGGDGAIFYDLTSALYERIPYLVAAVMLVTFVVLMMFFQSILLPLKAIFMNLATILATYGVLVLIFQDGRGAGLLGFEPLGGLYVLTPTILFVILFALSTDYEVFMLSRVKEYYHELGNNEEAVAAGLESTAGVITAAGLILVGTFGSFSVARVLPIKEIGLGLAIGVLLDSTIVRVIMVPATMRLMGNLNWWMPGWLKKIVPELREGPAPAPVPAPSVAMAAAAPAQPASIAAGTTELYPASVLNQRTVTQAAHAIQVGELHPYGRSVGTDLIVLPRGQPFSIGRGAENELQLFDLRISRRHARIDYFQSQYVITDLESINGVYVNGKRIEAPTTLRDGDQVEIGNINSVLFVFKVQTIPSRSAVAAT